MPRDAKSGTVELAILATLEHLDRFGLEILEEVQRVTNGAFSFKEGSLYPALKRLEKVRAIEGRWESSDRGGAARKYYHLTDDGHALLAHKREEWRDLRDALEVFLAKGNLA